MSRDIKFRAWILKDSYDENCDEYYMCYDLAFEDYEPINDLLKRVPNLMQYTGLKDKNGLEIYEGDIVQVTDGMASGKTYKSQVLWFDEGCQFITQTIEDDSGNWDVMQGEEFGGFYEIIGNIYEHSNLLT